jgi:hypothetical protein
MPGRHVLILYCKMITVKMLQITQRSNIIRNVQGLTVNGVSVALTEVVCRTAMLVLHMFGPPMA